MRIKAKTLNIPLFNHVQKSIALIMGSCLLASCERDPEASMVRSSITPVASNSLSLTDQTREEAYQRAKEQAVDRGNKFYQERLQKPSAVDMGLPNFEAGPGRPLPDYVNFYSLDSRFQAYLLCAYPIRVNTYGGTGEPKWFEAALKQIRHTGSKKFPPINWIAVVIRNVAEHKDANSFEKSFKVGAIFKASDVFDVSNDLSQLVAHAQMDRHPFVSETARPTPGEQQRWLIVEQHAATNNPATGLK